MHLCDRLVVLVHGFLVVCLVHGFSDVLPGLHAAQSHFGLNNSSSVGHLIAQGHGALSRGAGVTEFLLHPQTSSPIGLYVGRVGAGSVQILMVGNGKSVGFGR